VLVTGATGVGRVGEDIALHGDLRAVALMNLRSVEGIPGA